MFNYKIIKKYMKNILKKLEIIFNSIEVYFGYKAILNIIIIGFVCVYINRKNAVFILNENQILYLYSTTAQVIAGLYGLTLTGYVYFESRLNDISDNDETYIDHITTLKSEYFHDIFFIGIISGIAIIFSLICILSYREMKLDIFDVDAIFNLTMIVTLYCIISIISFSWKVLNPNKMNSISIKLKRKIEKEKMNIEYSDQFHENNFNVNLDESKDIYSEFMIIYSNLEKNLHEFADKVSNIYSEYSRINDTTIRARRPRVVTSIKVLEKNGIINNKDIEKLNYLRRYRNALIHGEDFKVDNDDFMILNEVNSYIEEKYKNWQLNK